MMQLSLGADFCKVGVPYIVICNADSNPWDLKAES
jgi:hypothetical protein